MKTQKPRTAVIAAAAFVAGGLVVAPAIAQISGQDDMEPGARVLRDMVMAEGRNMMYYAPADPNTDRMFAKVMAEHHKSAIEMARVEVRHGDDPALQAMAKKMIATQTKEREALLAKAETAK